MNTSYVNAIRARGDGRQSPPCNAGVDPSIVPTAASTLIPRDSTQNPNVMELETASTASNLTSQIPKLVPGTNPIKPSTGESLPDGYACNYAGFLIKTEKKRIYVSEELVATEARFLQDHLVVAGFIGGRPSSSGLTTWLSKLNAAIKGGLISYCGDLGRGFICLKASNQHAASQALILTPCRIDSFLWVF